MRAPISVIIPTLNAEKELGGCLTALLPGLEAGLLRELIVTDGGSSDGTVELARAWGAEVVAGAASRGGQLARGCAAAKGHWLLILHADTVLMPGWVAPVGRHLQSDDAGWFRLAFEQGGAAGRLVAGWANFRSQVASLPYGDQGILLPAQLYRSVGGYPDQPLMEDVALAQALRGRLRPIEVVAVTSAARYQRHGWVRRGAANLWLLARYFLGAKPAQLAASYKR